MQPRKRQFVLKFEDASAELPVFRPQRGYLRHQLFSDRVAWSIHPMLESGP